MAPTSKSSKTGAPWPCSPVKPKPITTPATEPATGSASTHAPPPEHCFFWATRSTSTFRTGARGIKALLQRHRQCRPGLLHSPQHLHQQFLLQFEKVVIHRRNHIRGHFHIERVRP